MITNVALRQRARRGLAWLQSGQADGLNVDVKRVDWPSLDMALSNQCVLGQAVEVTDPFWTDGFFDTWEYVQSRNDFSDNETTAWIVAHGFDTISNDAPHWDRLKAAWIDVAIENKLYKRPRKKASA